MCYSNFNTQRDKKGGDFFKKEQESATKYLNISPRCILLNLNLRFFWKKVSPNKKGG